MRYFSFFIPTYSVGRINDTNFGTFKMSEATAANTQSAIVGNISDFSLSGLKTTAFIFDGGDFMYLEKEGVEFSNVCSVNNATKGIVVGWASEKADGTEPNPIKWSHPLAGPNGNRPAPIVDYLGDLGGKFGKARCINDNEQIVGWSLNANATMQAFIYGNNRMTRLPGSENYSASEATSINSKGQVTGWIKTTGNEIKGFIYLPIADYGLPQGITEFHSPLFAKCQPQCINNNGSIVGLADTLPGENQSGAASAFYWNPFRGMEILEGFGSSPTIAKSINDKEQIVGFSTSTFFKVRLIQVTRACIWNDFTIYSLYDLLKIPHQDWIFLKANSINNSGEIVGLGLDWLGRKVGFRLIEDGIKQAWEFPYVLPERKKYIGGEDDGPPHPIGPHTIDWLVHNKFLASSATEPHKDLWLSMFLYNMANEIKNTKEKKLIQKAALNLSQKSIQKMLKEKKSNKG